MSSTNDPSTIVCIFDCVLITIVAFKHHDFELKINEESKWESKARNAKDDHDVVQTLHIFVIANIVVGASQAIVVINGCYLKNEKTAERKNGAKEFHGNDYFDQQNVAIFNLKLEKQFEIS